MTELSRSLDGFLDAAWQRLARGVADRRAPARHPVLATIGLDGAPQARIVVLRAADRTTATLEMHTDTATAKVAELTADPRAALHVWDPRAQLQLRLSGRVTILTGPEAAARWARVPEPSRPNYGVDPAPGTPIPDPIAFTRTPDQTRFAVLQLALTQIETLHLRPDPHRRAVFRRADAWQGQWIAP